MVRVHQDPNVRKIRTSRLPAVPGRSTGLGLKRDFSSVGDVLIFSSRVDQRSADQH